jgi:hypothetical protein
MELNINWIGVAGGVAAGVAAGVASVLTITHLAVFPLQAILSSALWVITRFNRKLSASLWRFSPVLWDEIILLPLPGLVDQLVILKSTYPAIGQESIAKVAAHRFQHRAARKALVRVTVSREIV